MDPTSVRQIGLRTKYVIKPPTYYDCDIRNQTDLHRTRFIPLSNKIYSAGAGAGASASAAGEVGMRMARRSREVPRVS